MNLSGQPVQMLAGFFKIKPEEILVVHDELDFEPGIARLKQGGGIAGHNGLKDISQRLGRTITGACASASASRRRARKAPTTCCRSRRRRTRRRSTQAIDRALQVLPEMLTGDMQAAMQKLHSSEPKPAPRRRSRRRKSRR